MSYPSLEQYNEAFQVAHLSLTDNELKQGTVATTGLGLPLALCGGFALTYTVKTPAKKYAVRCFHKKSSELEKRYKAISKHLDTLNSEYFVDFEFQTQGVRVGKGVYPIVKMSWAAGTTLGEFLEQNYRNSGAVRQLVQSLRTLATFLRNKGIAHGDIQPGNVMVADAGKKVQLIDYDGIFLDELKSIGSSELGHRNFQHPKRSGSTWEDSLDRFSFISLDLALRALEHAPELWKKTNSDGDSILFKANDFADPMQSKVFSELFQLPAITEDAKKFAKICLSSFEKTPSLEDFLADRGIPQFVIPTAPTTPAKPLLYMSAFPVLDATNYNLCLGHVGDKVELIGRIIEVKEDKTRRGKPYIFINFGPWQGHIVKITIWSEGLAALTDTPSQSWVGKWISVVGLMEPPYVSKRYKYSHLGISITQGNQLHLIADAEAKFRLAGNATRTISSGNKTSNQEILDNLKNGKGSAITPTRSTPQTIPQATTNQAILQGMRATQSSTPGTTSYRGQSAGTSINSGKASSNSSCFIATAIYGIDARETNRLRSWRDRRLLKSVIGRSMVQMYYKFSPRIVPHIKRHPKLSTCFKAALDLILLTID